MNVSEPNLERHPPVMRRRRGALCGLIVMLLGLWGALIPFVGPYFNFAYTPDPATAWVWTSARGWLEVLPGVTAFVGGFLLIIGRNRLTSEVGAILGALAGAWFIVGRTLAPIIGIDGIGVPDASGQNLRAVEELAYFGGLGALILFFSALMIGRLSTFGSRREDSMDYSTGTGGDRGSRHPKHEREVPIQQDGTSAEPTTQAPRVE